MDLGVREFRREERTGQCSDIVSVILLCLQVNYDMHIDSLEAVRRLTIAFKAAGIRNYRAARKQTLTEEQAIDRLAYANSLHGVDWRRVIFTDESQMFTNYAGPVRVYREASRRHSRAYAAPNSKQGRINVKFWGWMSREGAGMLQRIDGTLRTQQYIHILEHVFYPSVRKRYPDGPLLFLQDNYAVHKSTDVQRWLSGQRSKRLLCLPFHLI